MCTETECGVGSASVLTSFLVIWAAIIGIATPSDLPFRISMRNSITFGATSNYLEWAPYS